MPTTVGRVDFIASLDGTKLPLEARRLGKEIAAAGTKSGDDFGKNFETAFDRNISTLGRRLSNQLSGQGKLASERFTTTFNQVLRDRFSSMQDEIAHIFSDKDTFAKFVDDTGDLDVAVGRLQNSLADLREETVKYTDSEGRNRETAVLSAKAYRDMQVELSRLADGYRETQVEAERVEAQTRRLAAAQEDLDANLRRLIRTTGDTDSFDKLSKRVGGTEVAFSRLKRELEGTGQAIGASRGDIEEWVDRLEKTRDSVDKTNASLVKVDSTSTRLHKTWLRLNKLNPFSKLDNEVQLVIGLIAAAADQVAVLGSAAGAGFIALGGAVTSFIVGVAAGIPILINLNQELADAPAAMRPAIQSFSVLKSTLSGLSDSISQAAFDQMQGAFLVIAASAKSLEPALSRVGTALGGLIREFAQNTRPGTEAFAQIEKSIDNAVPNLEAMSRSAGTLGTALFRAFNRAQPLVEDFVGWVGKLVARFDSFTQGNDFNDWVTNAQRVWHAFGGTLDAVSRALSDLVTPEAVTRTVSLLDNLTRLAPSIGGLLDVIGTADPIGLLVDLLADFGEAMAPLTPSLKELFASLNVVLDAFSDGVTILAAVAAVAAPVAAALAGILNAVPPPVWTALATGISAVGIALATLKVGSAISTGLVLLSDKLIAVTDATLGTGKAFGTQAGLSSKLSRFASSATGVATIVGIAAGAFIELTEAAKALARQITDVDGKTRNALATNQSIISVTNDLSDATDDFALSTDNAAQALDGLSAWNKGNWFSQMGAAFGGAPAGVHDLNTALGELDKGLVGLPLEEQADKFNSWATELGASDSQILAMLDSMPKYKQALEDASAASGHVASDTDLVRLAMEGMKGATGDNTDGLDDMTEASGRTIRSISDLADAIRGFGDTALSQRDAARDYQAALDDLTDSIAENGSNLDINTAQGRANEAALDAIAKAALDNAAATKENTGSQDLANQALATGRQGLIDALAQFGITGVAAEQYADKLGLVAGGEGEAADKGAKNRASLQNTLEQFGFTGAQADTYVGQLDKIPGGVESLIQILNVDPSIKSAQDVQRAIDGIKNKSVTLTIRTVGIGLSGEPIYRLPNGATFQAAGGITSGPGVFVRGEEGPEAVVPLRRPLGMINPSVRDIAAYAQGKKGKGGSPGIVIEAGGVVLNESNDAPRAANEIVNRLFERVAG